ncbi:MAG: hypothetical protein M3Q51_04450 [Pseudomonadota bacterium]|nr:hypothetical protein [Pseudomonadota bacterium]
MNDNPVGYVYSEVMPQDGARIKRATLQGAYAQTLQNGAALYAIDPDDMASLRRDAERYRRLRDPPRVVPLSVWIAGQGNAHIESDWLTGEHADAAVDAMNGANA